MFSPQQEAVITWAVQGSGSVNVVARAGCGKTHTAVSGVVGAVSQARPRDEIAIMAYNKAAAGEVAERLTKLAKEIGEKTGDKFFKFDWKLIQSGTVHSFCFKSWRQVAPRVKVDDKKLDKIIDACAGGIWDSPYELCRGAIKKAVSLGKQSAFGFLTPLRSMERWYELIEHHGIDDDLTEEFTVDRLAGMCVDVLEKSIAQDYEVIDFDDMILAPLIHKARFWPKDLVILDEAQDTNAARRAAALAMIKPKTGRLMAIGDDRQAIYGFTGADSDAMEIIREQLNSAVLPLNVTWRCPKAVVNLAQRLVPDFTAAPEAPAGVVRGVPHLNDPVTPTGVAVRWFEGEGLAPGDAILCRNTKPLIEEAYALIRAGIGCMVEGREIGQGLLKLATRWTRVKTLPVLSAKLEEYREKETTKWLAKGREEKAAAIEDRVGCLQVLIEKVRGDGGTTVSDLSDAVGRLFADTDNGVPTVPRLMTIHKSKGREFDRVFFLGRRKFLPSKYARKAWQLKQEENLEYVGLTRAKRELIDIIME